MAISKIKLPGASTAQDIKDSGAQRRYTGTVQWVGEDGGANLPYPSPSDAGYGDLFIASDGIDASGRSNISMALHYGTSLRISRNGTSTSFNKTSTITVKVHKLGDGPDTYRKYRIYIQNNYLNVYETANNGGGEGDETRIGYQYITTLSSNPFYIKGINNGMELTWTETDTENPDLDDYITFDLVYKSEGVYQHNGTSWEAAPDLSKKADKATVPGGIPPSDMIAELDDYGNLKYNGHRISQFPQVEANPTVPSGTTPTALENLKVGNSYYAVLQGGSGTPSQHYYNCPLAEVTSPQEGDVCVVPETEEEVTADSNGDFAINGVSVRIEENESNPIPESAEIYILGSDIGILVDAASLPYSFTDYAGISKVGRLWSYDTNYSQYFTVYKIVPQATYVYKNGAWENTLDTNRQKVYPLTMVEANNTDGNISFWWKYPVVPKLGDIATTEEIVGVTATSSGSNIYGQLFNTRNLPGKPAFKVVLNSAIPSGTYSTVYITPYNASSTGKYTITAESGFYGKQLKITYDGGGSTKTIFQGVSGPYTMYLEESMSDFAYMFRAVVLEVFPNGNETSLLQYLTISSVVEAGVHYNGQDPAYEKVSNKVDTDDLFSRYENDPSVAKQTYPTSNSVIKAIKSTLPVIVADTTSTTVTLSEGTGSTADASANYIRNNKEVRFTQPLTSLIATSLSSISPNSYSEYVFWIVFTSGSTATSFTYPASWKWSGDDVDNGSFVPAVNKTYNICVWWDGVNLNAIARGTAYVASS